MNKNFFLKSAQRLAILAAGALAGAILWAIAPGIGPSGIYTFSLLKIATVLFAGLAGTAFSIGVAIEIGKSFRRPSGKNLPIAFLCIGMVMLAGPAFAQEATQAAAGLSISDLTPPPNDTSVRWLRYLFAPALPDGDGIVSSLGTTIGDMLATYNICILAVATTFLTYNCTVGIMQTAADGEFLGRHWSGLWAPLRVAAAFALLFPVNSGFTAGQVAVLKIAELGIGVGNQIWKTAATSLASAEPIIQIEVPSALKYARQAFYSQICTAYLNKHETEVRQRPFIAVQITSRADTTNGDLILSFDGQPGTAYPPAVCGRFSLPWSGAVDGVESISPSSAPVATEALFKGQAAAATWLMNKMGEIAFQTVDSYPTFSAPDLNAASSTLTTYQSRLLSAAADAQVALKSADLVALKSQMNRDGWVGAGKYWMDIARINAATAAAAQNVPNQTVPPDWTSIEAMTDRTMTAELLATGDAWWSQLAPSLDQRPNQSHLLDLVDPTRRDGKQSFPAFLSLIESGHFLLNTGLIAMGTAVAVDTVTTAVSWFTPAGRLANLIGKATAATTKSEDNSGSMAWAQKLGSVTRMIWLFAIPMVIAGFVLGYLLPLLPYMSFGLAALSWFLLVVQAVIAAPLWMLGHLRMDGHEFAPETAKMGYLMMLKILLYPALLLFGLVLSFVVFEIVAGHLSESFTDALRHVNGGDTSWSNIGYALVYVFFLLVVATKSMSLISELPDRVMAWISPHAAGAAPSQLGGAVAGAVAGAVVAGSRTATGSAGRAVTSVSKALGPKKIGKAGPVGGGGTA